MAPRIVRRAAEKSASEKLGSDDDFVARRIFNEQGDEYKEADFELIERDDLLYASAGEDWVRAGSPTAPLLDGAPSQPPAHQGQPMHHRRLRLR